MKEISYILVLIADIIFVMSMLRKDKLWIMILLLVSDVFYACQFFFLPNGLTSAVVIFIDCVYLLVMYLLQRCDKTKFNMLATLTALVLTIVLSVRTFVFPVSLLPMCGMLGYFSMMLFKNPALVKSGILTRNIFNVINMIVLTNYLGAGLEIALTISTIIGLVISIRDFRRNKTNRSDNLETIAKEE